MTALATLIRLFFCFQNRRWTGIVAKVRGGRYEAVANALQDGCPVDIRDDKGAIFSASFTL